MEDEVFHRRSSNDKEWQKVKKIVKERDKGCCRLCQVLTPSEMKISRDNCDSKNLFLPTDCAHVDAVSITPEEIYNPDNIFFLCRRHHSSIDNLINPVTNLHMTQNERWYWWWRIKMKTTDKYDGSIDYEDWYRNSKQKMPEEVSRHSTLEDVLNAF